MYIPNNRELGRLIAELCEDIWSKRHMLLDESKKRILLSYRVSISDHEADENVNFFFHYGVESNRWYFTVSDEPHFRLDDAVATIFFDDREDTDEQRMTSRVSSYRRYAFGDLVEDVVESKADAVAASLGGNPQAPYLWDTFPMERI